MCGICGFWTPASDAGPHNEVALKMAAAIARRGPDSYGCVSNGVAGPVFAHRRLAVIDTSEAGLQPMTSSGGRFSIVYNGEVYNHITLRAELEAAGLAPVWRGHSDTETLVACFEAWGIRSTLDRIVGMFAFAVWDNLSSTLTLARDRLGEKPLYYGVAGNSLLFSSELSALHEHPEFVATVDRAALTGFLERSYVPGPLTIYSDFKKLLPGHVLTVESCEEGASPFRMTLQAYWRLTDYINTPVNGTSRDSSDAVQVLKKILTNVVESQMISDVPVGAFLSGGVDSSLITAIMQEVSDNPVKTFSIGVEDKIFDESDCARRMADQLGSEHRELIVGPDHVLEVIPRLAEIYNEPFADSSQFPTFLVSELARRHVAVALTGDGADEMFGGYNRYLATGQISRLASKIPRAMRRAISRFMLSIPQSFWNDSVKYDPRAIFGRKVIRLPGDKIHKVARLLSLDSKEEYYTSLTTSTVAGTNIVFGGSRPDIPLLNPQMGNSAEGFENWMMAADALTYLPDDICVKVDRASMSNSLETRAPFLDKRIVEHAWSLPFDVKLRNGQTKWILREILSNYVPRALFDRPKMGFGIPLGRWLRDPLHDWADEMLSEDRLRAQSYLDGERVREIWESHRTNKGSHEVVLWNVLVFQLWADRWGQCG